MVPLTHPLLEVISARLMNSQSLPLTTMLCPSMEMMNMLSRVMMATAFMVLMSVLVLKLVYVWCESCQETGSLLSFVQN